MGIPKAIALSLVCHLFCFSFISFEFDRVAAASAEKNVSIDFLGSWLKKNEISPRKSNPSLKLDGLSYSPGRLPQSTKAVHNKPAPASAVVSSDKHWSKFLVAQKRTSDAGESAEDKYLAVKPAWDRVNLKLRIE